MGDVPTTDPAIILDFHCKLIEKMLDSDAVVYSLSGEPGDIGITLADPELRLKLILDGANTKLELMNNSDAAQVDPTLKMKWETALNFWLGNIDPVSALFTGKIKLEGQNMDPLFKLKSVVKEAKQASREVAEEFGWQDRSLIG